MRNGRISCECRAATSSPAGFLRGIHPKKISWIVWKPFVLSQSKHERLPHLHPFGEHSKIPLPFDMLRRTGFWNAQLIFLGSWRCCLGVNQQKINGASRKRLGKLDETNLATRVLSRTAALKLATPPRLQLLQKYEGKRSVPLFDKECLREILLNKSPSIPFFQRG